MKQKRTFAFPYRQRSILHIDIGSETFEILPLSEEDAKTFLGGRLLALELWRRFAALEKLDEKHYESGNPVVFAPGSASDLPMNCCSSFTVVTRSPITKKLSVNSASSPISTAIAGCGYSAVIITGRARRLTSFAIHTGEVTFNSAEPYHDLTTVEVAKRTGAEYLVAIGPAGEHFIPHASLFANYQNITHGGVGFVFGMKNVKFFTLHPQTTSRESYDPARLGLLTQTFAKELALSRIGRTVVKEGSIALLSKANHHGWAAIDNYSMRIDGRLWGLCPRTVEQREDSGEPSCPTCFQRSAMDLESAMALGSNLELFDNRSVVQLVNRCLENGLDPISTGGVLSWARKCRKDGKLSFLPDIQRASAMVYLRLLDAIAYQRGAGEQLGKALPELLQLYGGEEHAYMVDGIPLPPFDYRALPVQALLASLGDNRLVYSELLWGNRHHRGNERLLASWALYVQQFGSTLESVGLCPLLLLPSFTDPLFHFPRWKRKQRNLRRVAMLASLGEGYEIHTSKILQFGRHAQALEQKINESLGFRLGVAASLPDQLLVNGTSHFRRSQVVPLARLVDAYKSLSLRSRT